MFRTETLEIDEPMKFMAWIMYPFFYLILKWKKGLTIHQCSGTSKQDENI